MRAHRSSHFLLGRMRKVSSTNGLNLLLQISSMKNFQESCNEMKRIRSYRCQGGERLGNIEQLYQMYFKDVYLYLRAISKSEDIAEELTQETFFKALKAIDRFRGECDVRVWLCQIAKNTYYKYCEKNKKMITEPIEESVSDKTISLESRVVSKEQWMILKHLLQRMEEPYRKVFHLRVFGELSFREIGEACGKNENWARVTYYRAKNQIAKEMEEQYGKDEL